jgi:uncharacterized protein (DUF111 family)
VLPRRSHRVETSWGSVEGKIGFPDNAPARFSPEFESCRELAEKNNVPLREVYEAACRAFDPEGVKENL